MKLLSFWFDLSLCSLCGLKHPRNFNCPKTQSLKSNMLYQDVKFYEKYDDPRRPAALRYPKTNKNPGIRREMYYVDPRRGGKPWINKSVNFTQLTTKINKKTLLISRPTTNQVGIWRDPTWSFFRDVADWCANWLLGLLTC